MLVNDTVLNILNSPVRNIKARVELYNGSTLLNTFSYDDNLVSFTIERVGSGKFFGYGVCQKINVKVIDTAREFNLTTDNTLDVAFEVGGVSVKPFPKFKITEVHRDETTNELSITAYDWLNEAVSYVYSDLGITAPYDIKTLVNSISSLLGLSVEITDTAFNTFYSEGANFDGTENLREVLDRVAEATQTIYFINNQNYLVFKRLGGDAVFTIDKSKYFELENGDNRRLSAITHTTELGDNLTASTGVTGTTQYIRDNPFWELREDAALLLENAVAAVGGLTINQFTCSWRGNYLLEIGDKIALVNKDDTTVYSFVLDDVINYDGTLSQETQWSYEENEGETESNPTSLGDAIKQTFARVDKVNREIILVASEVEETNTNISNLSLTTEDIILSVKEVEQVVTEGLAAANEEIATLSQQAQLAVTKEDVQIAITTELANGVDKVTTATGYTFNEEGLTVSKTDSEITTTISEDGMRVDRNGETVLTANNEGVLAEDLNATTYLIIGTNSRFENYQGNRTGCFFIG